jgi:hypothetical protein
VTLKLPIVFILLLPKYATSSSSLAECGCNIANEYRPVPPYLAQPSQISYEWGLRSRRWRFILCVPLCATSRALGLHTYFHARRHHLRPRWEGSFDAVGVGFSYECRRIPPPPRASIEGEDGFGAESCLCTSPSYCFGREGLLGFRIPARRHYTLEAGWLLAVKAVGGDSSCASKASTLEPSSAG